MFVLSGVVRVYPSVALNTAVAEDCQRKLTMRVKVQPQIPHGCIWLLLTGSFSYVSKQNFDGSNSC